MRSETTIRSVPLRSVAQERALQGHLIALIPVLTLYFVLGLFRLDHQSLWTDEVISLNIARSDRSVLNLWLTSQCPLYYFMLRGWTWALGTSEFALRSLSVILGAFSVCLMYAIGQRLFDRRVAALAALLLATSPLFIWYSQEVRYINLMLATALLAVYALQGALSSDRPAWWCLYTGASVLAVFSFVSVIFLFAAHALYLLWSERRRAVILKWVLCQLVVFTFFAAWFGIQYGPRLASSLTQKPRIVSPRYTLDGPRHSGVDLVATIPYTFFAFSAGFSAGPSVRELHLSRSPDRMLGYVSTLVPLAIFFGMLFLLGLARLRRDPGVLRFVLPWLVVPILSVFAVSAVTSFGVYNVRYVGVAFPAYLLILAAGIFMIQRSNLWVAVTSAVLLVNAWSLGNYYFDSRYAKEDARAAAEYIKSAARPGDVLVVVGNSTPVTHYYQGDLPIVRFDARGYKDGSEIAKNLRDIGSDHRRLWMIEIRSWETDPGGRVKAVLDQLAARGEHRSFPGVDVYAYRISQTSDKER